MALTRCWQSAVRLSRTYFFSSCSPAAAGSRAQICAVGFVGNPDLLSLPPSKVLSCWHAARAAAYLATPVPHFEPLTTSQGPRRPRKGQGPTHVGHAHAGLAGVGPPIPELDSLGLAMQPADTWYT